MKLISSVFIFLTVVIVGVYTLLFTSLGHGILIPIIENKIKQNTKIDTVTVKSFSLNPNQFSIVVDMNKSIIQMDSKFNIFDRGISGNYKVDIQDLSLFSKLTHSDLKGSVLTYGTLNGKFDNLDLKGKTIIAKGDLEYSFNVTDDLKDINFHARNLDLSTLLLMLGQKQYAKGSINIDGEISSLSHLDGGIKTVLNNGFLNEKLIEKDFAFSLPKNSAFIVEIDSKLSKKSIQNKINIDSFVGTLTSKNSELFLDSKLVQSDYKIAISDMGKLSLLTKQKMRGDIIINGDITIDKKLLATFHSNIFDGSINGKLDGNKLQVHMKKLQTLPLLHTLYYPEIFRSSLDGDIDFDMVSKKGNSLIKMYNGQFLTNEAMSTLKKLTNYDLTLEIYETSTLSTEINNTILDNKLLMTSKNSTIKSDKMIVNTQNSTIDAKIDLLYKKLGLGINLDGSIASPNIKVKVDNALKEKVKDKAKKELDRFMEKNLDDRSKDNLKNLIKGLF